MIKRIRLIHHKTSVWSKGSIYPDKSDIPEGKIVYEKTYHKPIEKMDTIWHEVRREAVKSFFDIFYPDVVERTGDPDPPYRVGEHPDDVAKRQSKYIQKRITDLPAFYDWSERHKKWILSYGGYVERVTEQSGLDISLSIHPDDKDLQKELTMRPEEMIVIGQPIDYIQALGKYKTISLILFVYPDRYDQEIRAILELVIDFV
jgi:hypothetical protein